MAVTGIEKSLVSIFAIASAYTQIDKLKLEKDEAELLAHSIAEVNRYYKLPVMKPEHVAIASLVGVVISVGRKKLVAVVEHKAGKRGKPSAPATAPANGMSEPASAVPASASWFPDLTAAVN